MMSVHQARNQQIAKRIDGEVTKLLSTGANDLDIFTGMVHQMGDFRIDHHRQKLGCQSCDDSGLSLLLDFGNPINELVISQLVLSAIPSFAEPTVLPGMEVAFPE